MGLRKSLSYAARKGIRRGKRGLRKSMCQLVLSTFANKNQLRRKKLSIGTASLHWPVGISGRGHFLDLY